MLASREDILGEIEKISILHKNIPLTYLKDNLNSIRYIVCKKGQQFIMEGAPISGLFFTITGKAKVFKTGIYGKEQIVRLVGGGEIIGHRGFVTQDYYSIAAIAIEETKLCYFSNDTLHNMFSKYPSFTYDLMLFYAKELNRSEAKVKSLSQMTVRERVIDTLLFVNRKFGLLNGFLNLALSRKEYADYAGTSEEQVIRVLSALKQEGFICTKAKRIGILDIDALKNEISEHNFYLDN